MLEAIRGRGLFVQRYDAVKRRVIFTRMRLIAALRVLAYGNSFDEVDELVAASASSVWESFLSFTEEVVNVFGYEYLRYRTDADLKRILVINAERGFSRMRRKLELPALALEELSRCLGGTVPGQIKKRQLF